MINTGTSLQVRPEGLDGGGLVVNNNTFSLKQFHFHTPGEHRVNGEYFPMEMHLVHESAGKHPVCLASSTLIANLSIKTVEF
jgi:carbonic anhydrase